MNAASPSAQSATPMDQQRTLASVPAPYGEDDFAIGCECANPALQIEVWGREAGAQPLQQVY